MTLSSTSIPKPKNWQDFETSMCTLMRCELDDPQTSKNGRQGQPQCGVDIYGSRNREAGRLVGIQCKQKLGDKVSKTELKAEVTKAQRFQPKLSEFILATTAPRDQAIQEVARKITKKLASTNHPMTVAVWGWEDIEEHASQYDEAFKAFDPTWNPFSEKLLTRFEQIEQTLKQFANPLNTRVQQPSSGVTEVTPDEAAEDTPLHGKISAYIELVEQGYVTAALGNLERIKSEEWETASRSERYRLLTAIGAAKIRDGDYEGAGLKLLEAFDAYPDHRKAKQNRAKGHLLTNEYAKAAEIATEILRVDEGNADAASTLIQARMHDSSLVSPLEGVPPGLRDTEDVLIAHIHFLRSRGDSAWVDMARTSMRAHPNSHQLKIMAAEAALDLLTRLDRDVIAGASVKAIGQDELRESVNVLRQEALHAIEKRLRMPISIALNAALALRFVSDIPSAIQILDAAIQLYPTDEDLVHQRAILAFSQNDLPKVLELIPGTPVNVEAVPMKATALADTGRPDEALRLIEGIDASKAADGVRVGILSARCHAYLALNEATLAIETAREAACAAPDDSHVAAVLIRTLYLAGESAAASTELDAALARVSESSSMSSRLLLSFEAQRLDRYDAIVALLHGHVATSHESEALQLLVTSAINGRFWVAAQDTIESLPAALVELEWVQRARTILAINTGSNDAENLIGAYLGKWPHDAPMLLARVGVWERRGRIKDVESLLGSLDISALRGSPVARMRLAAAACRYGDVATALDQAYTILMDNWNTPSVHLVYQGVILLNSRISSVLPDSDLVAENTVVCIGNEEGDQRYRFERKSHAFFEHERLDLKGDLAALLLGKRVGDTFQVQKRIGAKPVTVKWVKSVYVDACHQSLEQFNQRFPRSNGMMKLTFDPSAADPLESMREITKQRAESDMAMLQRYQATGLPLAFIAGAMGREPIETWQGLPSAGVPFLVCRGAHQEREAAVRLIQTRDRTGCVLDAITLSLIRRLGVGDAIATVCGPCKAPQAVLDVLAERSLEAAANVGRTMGFAAWRDGQLVVTEYSDEVLKKAAEQAELDRAWAMANVTVVPAMPRKDLSHKIRSMLAAVGQVATDPAVAANGSGLLLLSDDMGLRVWAEAELGVKSAWIQPALMVARREGVLSDRRYFDAINLLAQSGHTYTSLEAGALLQQARNDGFELTDDLRLLLDAVGGPTADLESNCSVIAQFLDSVISECSDDQKLARIIGQSLSSMSKGRFADQRTIVSLVIKGSNSTRRRWLTEYALGWLIGHSIGSPDFPDIVAAYRRLFG